ncbi:PilW family protein [Acinetobacter sp. BY484]|uniref:PilW family protein n=1 Tax=Acinetobacter sp. BY484 TaxID=2820674 RepID=UPI001C24D8E1|nr:PilW family protein [Acinetobacter sp. BY484]
MSSNPYKQTGFTLIELMISLALGLIIMAAAIMLFLTGQKSSALQQGVANIQDDANFGLGYIAQDIRHTNLNSLNSGINDRTIQGGIVLTSSANGFKDTTVTPNVTYSNLPENLIGTTVATNLLSSGATGLSNVQGESSDQLVIQYRPQYTRVGSNWVGGFDCEGEEIKFPVMTGGVETPLRIIVQRYFLREDTNKDSKEPNTALALACDAGWYSESGTPLPDKIESFGNNGEVIMKRVDYFHVMLGIQNGERLRYISINDYMALSAPRPRILSVQLGALVRSVQGVGNEPMIKDDQEFQVLDKKVTVKVPTNTTSKYVRQVVSQTVALRNTFGERGQ